MPRLKDTFAVVKLTTEGAEILERFQDRESGNTELKRRRDAIEDVKEKYTVALLPMEKGQYLLPPK